MEPRFNIPDNLTCPRCKDILHEAVMMPCCVGTVCDDCARSIIEDSHRCLLCNEPIIVEDLIPYRLLRDKVDKFRTKNGYLGKKKEDKHHQKNDNVDLSNKSCEDENQLSVQDIIVFPSSDVMSGYSGRKSCTEIGEKYYQKIDNLDLIDEKNKNFLRRTSRPSGDGRLHEQSVSTPDRNSSSSSPRGTSPPIIPTIPSSSATARYLPVDSVYGQARHYRDNFNTESQSSRESHQTSSQTYRDNCITQSQSNRESQQTSRQPYRNNLITQSQSNRESQQTSSQPYRDNFITQSQSNRESQLTSRQPYSDNFISHSQRNRELHQTSSQQNSDNVIFQSHQTSILKPGDDPLIAFQTAMAGLDYRRSLYSRQSQDSYHLNAPHRDEYYDHYHSDSTSREDSKYFRSKREGSRERFVSDIPPENVHERRESRNDKKRSMRTNEKEYNDDHYRYVRMKNNQAFQTDTSYKDRRKCRRNSRESWTLEDSNNRRSVEGEKEQFSYEGEDKRGKNKYNNDLSKHEDYCDECPHANFAHVSKSSKSFLKQFSSAESEISTLSLDMNSNNISTIDIASEEEDLVSKVVSKPSISKVDSVLSLKSDKLLSLNEVSDKPTKRKKKYEKLRKSKKRKKSKIAKQILKSVLKTLGKEDLEEMIESKDTNISSFWKYCNLLSEKKTIEKKIRDKKSEQVSSSKDVDFEAHIESKLKKTRNYYRSGELEESHTKTKDKGYINSDEGKSLDFRDNDLSFDDHSCRDKLSLCERPVISNKMMETIKPRDMLDVSRDGTVLRREATSNKDIKENDLVDGERKSREISSTRSPSPKVTRFVDSGPDMMDVAASEDFNTVNS